MGQYNMNESIKVAEVIIDPGKIEHGIVQINDLFADGQPLE